MQLPGSKPSTGALLVNDPGLRSYMNLTQLSTRKVVPNCSVHMTQAKLYFLQEIHDRSRGVW